ncbi:acetyl/propionyl/methylcrotonyl-CoA carboxylase subunit alpha [Oceanicoccus sp. KOV_DT_Chl]|uniref:acetyl/propionyl/methylcrotonyl-CoA carboxylase subunit alpha n=1 Tax=Oceanicoccus sp. KOV_DT_Chl TaxID=1904639 RepID=UPI000C7DDA3C|nr:acetyl/propionyl/methylcrotonyl-CoA carboxylase subunit alpha [Oceanicoccus sp. KOV_DT_Chl]
MFDKILIANRGEIACRVIKTARQMGIRTVAVYSDADSNALHVAMADEAVHIGAAPSRESYLLMENVIKAAKQTGAQAIHPGYGFLSENAAFCQLCIDNGICFIGPPITAIQAMGSKSAAKTIMEKAGVPLVPGYHGDNQDAAFLKKTATAMGYPVLLKAAAGGGGKGMRQVWSADEFDEALATAKREAMSSFSDDIMLVEKYLTQPRHVEIQVFCDQHNNAVYLAERDCSVQRRHQKVIEEAPAPGMSESLRQQMGAAAIEAAQAINYQGAGTVEFLLDSDGSFFFMEMNTRLQVEHPVTEMITGQDLVEWQFRVAAGEPLPFQQDQIQIDGHAIEVRIYAEDPANDFLPATGTLSFLETPTEDEHTRIDTGVRQGDTVSVYYDPMIAKLIVWDEDRPRALKRMAKALTEYRINGVTTNIDFLYNLSTCKPFVDADLDTGFIEKHRAEIFHDSAQDMARDIPLAALYLILKQQQQAAINSSHQDPSSPWNQSNSWRLNEANIHCLQIQCHQKILDVTVEETSVANTPRYMIRYHDTEIAAQGRLNGNILSSDINGYRSRVSIAEESSVFSLYSQQSVFQFSEVLPDLGDDNSSVTDGGLTAPMNGTIVALLVNSGAAVKQGDPLIVMEAMKMEYTIRAPGNGTVTEFYFQAGSLVDGGAELLAFETNA